MPYTEHPAIGRFEGDRFDPTSWKPRVPTGAFLNSRADDEFWAARRVAAFSDAMIRASVSTGRYSDLEAERQLAETLRKRRDRIAAAYLTAMNPIVDVALDPTGTLTFANAAVIVGVAGEPRGGYRTTWFAFDPPHASWSTPVRVYFRRQANGWTLVGLERMPEEVAP